MSSYVQMTMSFLMTVAGAMVAVLFLRAMKIEWPQFCISLGKGLDVSKRWWTYCFFCEVPVRYRIAVGASLVGIGVALTQPYFMARWMLYRSHGSAGALDSMHWIAVFGDLVFLSGCALLIWVYVETHEKFPRVVLYAAGVALLYAIAITWGLLGYSHSLIVAHHHPHDALGVVINPMLE